MENVIDLAAKAIEMLAVAIIVIAVVHGALGYLLRIGRRVVEAYNPYKIQLGKGLLLGLELLVAADIIRTVALEPTMQSVVMLALLVLIRTFLSWSLVVEIEERWPWQGRKAEIE